MLRERNPNIIAKLSQIRKLKLEERALPNVTQHVGSLCQSLALLHAYQLKKYDPGSTCMLIRVL